MLLYSRRHSSRQEKRLKALPRILPNPYPLPISRLLVLLGIILHCYPPHVPSPSLANSTPTGGSAVAASNSSQIPKNLETTSQGVSAQLPNSTQPVAQQSTFSNEQNLSNSEQVFLQQNNIDDDLDVSGTRTFVVKLGNFCSLAL